MRWDNSQSLLEPSLVDRHRNVGIGSDMGGEAEFSHQLVLAEHAPEVVVGVGVTTSLVFAALIPVVVGLVSVVKLDLVDVTEHEEVVVEPEEVLGDVGLQDSSKVLPDVLVLVDALLWRVEEDH
jgi:hypothetical protein